MEQFRFVVDGRQHVGDRDAAATSVSSGLRGGETTTTT